MAFDLQKREQRTQERWAELAESLTGFIAIVATGGDVDDDELDSLLIAAGLDDNDFMRDVEEYQRRLALADTFEQGIAANKRVAEVQARMDAHQEAWKVVRDKHRAEHAALFQEQLEVSGISSEGYWAENALRETASPALIKKLDALESQHLAYRAEIERHELAIKRQRNIPPKGRPYYRTDGNGTHRATSPGPDEKLIASHEAQIRSLRSKIEANEIETSSIRRSMLEPASGRFSFTKRLTGGS